MGEKPEWRDEDESPKRHDDIHVKAFGVDVEASGRTVILVLLTAALIGFGFFHDWKSDGQHSRMAEVQTLNAALNATQICVVSLNEQEKREFRIEGKYCHDALREVREYLRRQDLLPEKRSEFWSVYAANLLSRTRPAPPSDSPAVP